MKKSEENWDLKIDPSVFKVLKKFPEKDSEYIWKSMNILHINPYLGDIKKLKGENSWRKRIGAYRIFYEIQTESKLVLIFHLERRTSNTY